MKQHRCGHWHVKNSSADMEAAEQPSYVIENNGHDLIWRECEDGEGGTIYWFERVPK